jgi:cellulose synthase/poly-beta-1,6-N-acetylglucosamine synthase-like glycosyltransferase
MILYFTYLLVASSAFVAMYYYFIYQELDDEEIVVPENLPKVSILMPAFNEENVVGESLENILNLSYPDYEVILVNDASTDNTLEEVEKFSEDSKLQVIDLETNQGKAGALNKGLEQVEGVFTVVQDADSVIQEGLLQKSVAKMMSNSNLGGVISRIQPLNRNSFFRKLQVTEYTVTNFYRNLMCSIDVLDVTPGAFATYRTKDLKEIGGFDRNNLTEDLDVALRLRKKGRSLGMVYDKVSRTELPETYSDLKGQRVRWARGFIQNAKKHKDMFFNSEYGWFGKFQLPLHVMMPAIAVMGLSLILYGVLEAVYNLYLHVSAAGFSFALGELNLMKMVLGFQWKIYIPLVAGLAVTGFMIREAYKSSGRNVNHLSSLLFYFLGFFAVKAIFWSTAIFKEITRKSKVWT